MQWQNNGEEMTNQEIEYHLKMLADSVQMMSCMFPIPDYEGAIDPSEAQQWFRDKLELIHHRCADVINYK